MNGRPVPRVLTILVSAVLLATLAAATLAASASAKPKCAGKPATIVGTAGGEVIRGTPGNDVIVARGGHDIILGKGGRDIVCGNAGNDRLVGGPGNDQLLGQVGRDKLLGGAGRDWLVGGPSDDQLNGGPGDDACFQGSGVGARVDCERPPVPVVAPPPPAPKVLAIAYSDIDGSPGFGAGDVMINRIDDTNGDGILSPGDTIVMGKTPVTPTPTTTGHFVDWGVKSHVIAVIHTASSEHLNLTTTTDGHHYWQPPKATVASHYVEAGGGLGPETELIDRWGTDLDVLRLDQNTPSQPPLTGLWTANGSGDDKLIDVEFLY